MGVRSLLLRRRRKRPPRFKKMMIPPLMPSLLRVAKREVRDPRREARVDALLLRRVRSLMKKKKLRRMMTLPMLLMPNPLRAKVKARRVVDVDLLRERRVARDLRVLSLMKRKKKSRRTTTPLLMPLRTNPPRGRSLKKERNPLMKSLLRARSQQKRRVRTPRRNPAK